MFFGGKLTVFVFETVLHPHHLLQVHFTPAEEEVLQHLLN